MAKAPRNKEPLRALAYVQLMPTIAEVARACGYAACFHGSLHTDMDVVLCPWVEDATDAETVVEAIRQRIGGIAPGGELKDIPTPKPHGRMAWAYYFHLTCAQRQDGPYVDISVMPRQQP